MCPFFCLFVVYHNLVTSDFPRAKFKFKCSFSQLIAAVKCNGDQVVRASNKLPTRAITPICFNLSDAAVGDVPCKPSKRLP